MLKLYSVTDFYASLSLEVFRHPAKTNQVDLLHTSQPSEMLSAAALTVAPFVGLPSSDSADAATQNNR